MFLFYIKAVIVVIPLISALPDSHPFVETILRKGDQDATESFENVVQVVRPMTYGSAVHTEARRLQSLQDVFPPQSLSYFIPYGDRTIVSLRFPSISKESLEKSKKAGYGHGPSDTTTSSQYELPKDKYGPPVPMYGPPKQPTKQPAGDLGVIISENYILRENIRDYFNFSKLDQKRPSNELVIELAKAFAERINLESLSGFPYGGYQSGPKSEVTSSPSFVLVSIESRVRTSPEAEKFGFTRGGGLTNGTLIFPSPANPSVLTNIPFVLRGAKDIDRVFEGYQSNSDGLIPLEKTEIKNFLKLVSGINEDIHGEGRDQIGTLLELSGLLDRPRLPDFTEFQADPLFEDEARARMTNWLYTSTVGIRILSSSPSVGNQNRYKASSDYKQPVKANSYSPVDIKDNSYGTPNKPNNVNSYSTPSKPNNVNSYDIPNKPGNVNSYEPLKPVNSYELPAISANVYKIMNSAPWG